MGELVTGSEAAVVGTVLAVSEPTWNSADGEPFDGSDDEDNPGGLAPLQYREVTILTREVLWSSSELPVRPLEELTVTAVGDGSDTGCRVEFATVPLKMNNASGPYEAGTDVLYLLTTETHYIKDLQSACGRTPGCREDQALMTNGGYAGNWILRGETAHNMDPERTFPKDQLIAKLLAEREEGS